MSRYAGLVTLEDIRRQADAAVTEQEIADAFALAENKTWWAEKDIYECAEGSEPYKEALRITDQWLQVAAVLRQRIFAILRAEGVRIPRTGYVDVLIPFMERNGYRNASGWWARPW